jgi:hypothetical protein
VKLILVALLGLALPALLGAAWVRLAPSDPALWHVDPQDVTRRGGMNSFLAGPGGDRPAVELPNPPGAVAARLDAIAMATPRTARLAGEGTFVTYVTRSALFGFPDYTTVRILPTAMGSEVLIFARSRFGKSDLGVNRKRVEDWIARLVP